MPDPDPTAPAKVATEDYVQARVAEMEGKLERAVRELTGEIRAEVRDFRTETQRRIDAMHAENSRLLRWMIGIGVVLTLAVLIRPTLG